MTRGDETDLQGALGNLLRRLDRKSGGGYRQMQVARAWSEIAGPAVDSHTAGAHLREKELVVFVDGPAWATELSALADRYRVAMNEALGKEMVSSVRFVVSRHVAERKALDEPEAREEDASQAEKATPMPLSDQERAQVEASAAGIPDEELRQAVVQATVADLEWKKGRRAHSKREAGSQDR